MQYDLLKGWLFFVLVLMLLVNEKNYGQPVTVSDSIRVSIAPDYNKVGKLHRRFFGNGYRSSWAAPVWLRVCYLSKENGGLTVVKKGGGLQTKSLRLKDSSGKEWVLRTIQKYPEQGLPPNIRSGLAKDILQDQVVTAHPFASLTIPPLAEALGITHSSPEIIYVADDTALREFRKEFANAVYLLEEREPTGDTDNSEKVQEALQNNHDIKVEQMIVLRARLLDIILGDWDRHEDQWRWKKQKEKSNTFYTPVPRDRAYPGTQLGDRVIVQAGAVLGSDGFGYVFTDGAHQKIAHVGRLVIEADVEIGANTTIDRGSVGDTVIGAGTKIDNLVQIAHNVRMGKCCLVMSQVGISGSTQIGDGVVIAGQAGLAGHITIGAGARIAGQSGVFGDVPAGETWSGYPARPHRESLRVQAAAHKLPAVLKTMERARGAE